MKKILRLIAPAVMLLLMALTAHAYNVVNLPESMTFADALEIFSADDISNITVSDIADGSYTTLTSDEIHEFYNVIKDLRVHRTINPTPFRGIAVNVYSGSGSKAYCLNSGIEIGLYGKENYVCYKLSDFDAEKLLYLESKFWENEARAGGEWIHRATSRDFLKLPDAPWARAFAEEAAAKNLLPYDFTASYSDNITREKFCRLLGNFLTVNDNYKSLEAFMSDQGGAYLRNYFVDCEYADNSVNILYALGIVNGRDDTHFDPNGIITREEAATLLCRAAERYMWIGTETTLPYEDSGSVSEWARFYVTWVNEYGVMTGVSDTEFDPQGVYTVEQAVATMVRLYNLVNG